MNAHHAELTHEQLTAEILAAMPGKFLSIEWLETEYYADSTDYYAAVRTEEDGIIYLAPMRLEVESDGVLRSYIGYDADDVCDFELWKAITL